MCRASDKCQREKRKTINGDDLLWALQTLCFSEYVEPLKVYLQKYREAEVGPKVPLDWSRHPSSSIGLPSMLRHCVPLCRQVCRHSC